MKRAIGVTFTLVAALVTYAHFIRPWHNRWGATDKELTREMPLDYRVPHPTSQSTRAITINVPPDKVWPWIVQMGEPPRAGYYSYTWIERLIGLHITNAGRILPEYQTVMAGTSLDKKGDMYVHAVSPGNFLVLGPPPRVRWLQCTWAICLYGTGDGRTRLITRVRGALAAPRRFQRFVPLFTPLFYLLDPGVFIMEYKMLTEIKRFAEHNA